MIQEVTQGRLVSDISSKYDLAERHFYFFCKRCIDTVLALLHLVLAAPLMLIIAIMISMDTPGSVVFVSSARIHRGLRSKSRQDASRPQESSELQGLSFRAST